MAERRKIGKGEYTCCICNTKFVGELCKPPKTCSRKCANLLLSRQRKGIRPLNGPQPNPTSFTCKRCGKERTMPLAHAKRRVFCSRLCKSLWQSEHVFGKNHPRYKGGVSFPNRGDNWSAQRAAARERDGNKCVICKRKPKQGEKYVIDVHHIVPFKLFDGNIEKANDLSNLVCLCRRHHRQVERGKIPCPRPLL